MSIGCVGMALIAGNSILARQTAVKKLVTTLYDSNILLLPAIHVLLTELVGEGRQACAKAADQNRPADLL